jgi:hypothetical protein
MDRLYLAITLYAIVAFVMWDVADDQMRDWLSALATGLFWPILLPIRLMYRIARWI